MSTDLARIDQRQAVEPAGPSNDLMTWAFAARQAHEIALQLAETSFVPKAMYRRPGEVTGAILAGRELGLEPMSALRSIDIIDGTPAMRAHALRGLVQSHGHQVWVEESTEHRAVVCGQRRRMLGQPEPRVERSMWTMDRARKAGLANKKNWSAHPQAMLVARATAEVCRLVAADVLLGMPYCAEEVADGLTADPTLGVDLPVEPATTKPKTRRIQREPVKPAEPEPAKAPEVDECLRDGTAADCPADSQPDETSNAINMLEAAGFEVEVIADDASAAPDPMTAAQRARLNIEFRRHDISDRDARLDFVKTVIGREIASSSELTKDEATAVIRELTRPEDAAVWPQPARPPDGAL